MGGVRSEATPAGAPRPLVAEFASSALAVARLLVAAALACGAGPAHSLGPWELAAGLQVDPVYRERTGRPSPVFGAQGWASLGPFAATLSMEGDARTTKPVDLFGPLALGVGLRLAPAPWLSLQAVALVVHVSGQTTDVNLRDWVGPYFDYSGKGLRLHAAVGPRLRTGRLPEGRWWRPVLAVTWTRCWARTYGDRFRTWGGDASYLSVGLGVEIVARVR